MQLVSEALSYDRVRDYRRMCTSSNEASAAIQKIRRCWNALAWDYVTLVLRNFITMRSALYILGDFIRSSCCYNNRAERAAELPRARVTFIAENPVFHKV